MREKQIDHAFHTQAIKSLSHHDAVQWTIFRGIMKLKAKAMLIESSAKCSSHMSSLRSLLKRMPHARLSLTPLQITSSHQSGKGLPQSKNASREMVVRPDLWKWGQPPVVNSSGGRKGFQS
jgi:hypothetical protein